MQILRHTTVQKPMNGSSEHFKCRDLLCLILRLACCPSNDRTDKRASNSLKSS